MLRKSVLLFALVLSAAPAFAADYSVGAIKIHDPWSRATPKGAPIGGGYVTITNTGTTPDRLTGGTTDSAKKFEIHEMKMEGSVMRMRELTDGIVIPPGATVELKPGSYHIMMTTLARPFAQGDRVKASLTFERAGKVDIEFAVDAAGGGGTKDHKH